MSLIDQDFNGLNWIGLDTNTFKDVIKYSHIHSVRTEKIRDR